MYNSVGELSIRHERPLTFVFDLLTFYSSPSIADAARQGVEIHGQMYRRKPSLAVAGCRSISHRMLLKH